MCPRDHGGMAGNHPLPGGDSGGESRAVLQACVGDVLVVGGEEDARYRRQLRRHPRDGRPIERLDDYRHAAERVGAIEAVAADRFDEDLCHVDAARRKERRFSRNSP
jgi:hypothetical protein